MTIQNNDTADRVHLFPAGEDQVVLVQPYDMEIYDEEIHYFYKKKYVDPLFSAATFFLDRPYLFEALGEGPDAPYSQEPLYRTDKFDCVTYVNTVLALMHSSDLTEFKKNMLAIRYHHLPAHYIHRTDWFTDLEWLPNTRQLDWIEDVTQEVVDQNKKPIAVMAETVIDKSNWYNVRPLKAMHLLTPFPSDQNALLARLRLEGKIFQAQPSKLSYLPFDKLFNAEGVANDYLFNQIPSRSVIIIARPHWKIRDNFPGFSQGYGTNLNVSHLGIVFRVEKKLLFYHASSLHRKVECVSLIEYLKGYIDSPTVKGIHVERIR